MKRRKIVIILPSLVAGGAEKVILNFFHNIDTKYFEPILIIQNKIGPLNINNTKEKIIYLNSNKFRYAFIKLVFILIKLKPKIILSTFPHITLSLLLFKKIFFKKVLFIARIPNMVKPSIDNSSFHILFKFLHRFFMPLSNMIIVTSEAMKNDFLLRGIKKEKCFLIRNPIDNIQLRNINQLIRFPGEGLRLVFVGRLVYQKGLDRILNIIKNTKNCHLTIIGDGPKRLFLEKLIIKNNIVNKVKFTGYSDNANAYIAAADYFLLPSRWEGLPNVVLESLVLGTPVISFNEIKGLQDLIPLTQKNKLFLCKNEEEMEELIFKLDVRNDYLKPIVRKVLLKNFNTPQAYAKKIEKIIKDLIFEKKL